MKVSKLKELLVGYPNDCDVILWNDSGYPYDILPNAKIFDEDSGTLNLFVKFPNKTTIKVPKSVEEMCYDVEEGTIDWSE